MSRKNKIDEQTRKAWSDAAAEAAKIRREEQRIAKMAHVTITVGARRSCHFYPAPPVASIPWQWRDETRAEYEQRGAEQRARQLEIDAAIYHAPLDSKPARPRKPGKPLAACEAAGKRAIGADDLKACKRPVAVAIPYTSDAGDLVVAIFGGLTQAAADSARHGTGGIEIPQSIADQIVNGETLANWFAPDRESRRAVEVPRAWRGARVVIWPSEAMRRGAATVCTVAADATVDDLRRDYPVIDERPAEVQRLIDLHDERAAEYRHAA